MANCLGANFVGAIDLAFVTSLRRCVASTCRVYRLRAEVVRHGWMGYACTGVQYPEIAGNDDRVVSRVLWGSYGGVYGVELSNRVTRYGPVLGDTLALGATKFHWAPAVGGGVAFRFGVERLNRLALCQARTPRARRGCVLGVTSSRFG